MDHSKSMSRVRRRRIMATRAMMTPTMARSSQGVSWDVVAGADADAGAAGTEGLVAGRVCC